MKRIFKKGREAAFIAEIGLNHNGDFSTAKKMIELAAVSGADAVKFQIFSSDFMVSPYGDSLLHNGVEGSANYSTIDFFREFDLLFFASVFDLPSLDLTEEIGVELYKLASSELTNIPLIRAIGKTAKPVIISTGMARDDEIAIAINSLKKSGGGEVVLLHCVSLYPTDDNNVNINRIFALKEQYGLDVGLSDHSGDYVSAMLSVVAGARIFEKHFKLDENFDCPDGVVSLSPTAFSNMVSAVLRAIRMMGSGKIHYGEAEGETAKGARRSIFSACNISKGDIIGKDELKFLRPGIGISPSMVDSIVGKKALVDIKKDYLIRGEDIEGF